MMTVDSDCLALLWFLINCLSKQLCFVSNLLKHTAAKIIIYFFLIGRGFVVIRFLHSFSKGLVLSEGVMNRISRPK